MKKFLLVLGRAAESEAAIARMISLADAGTVSELLTIVHEPSLDGYLGNTEIYAPLRQRLIDEAAAKAAQFEESVKSKGIKVTSKTIWDWSRGDAIRREAESFGADVIVMTFGFDAHRHIGSRDWRFLAECPVPILVVNSDGKEPYSKIMAAVDPVHAHAKPSELDAQIVATAANVSRRAGGKLGLVHCFLPLSRYGAHAGEIGRVPLNDAEQALERSRKAALAQLTERAGLDAAADIRLIEGDPVDSLEQLAEEGEADLIVLGALARGKLASLIIGSTAERLLHRVVCDLLLVKPAVA
jgi:universal stress protein E